MRSGFFYYLRTLTIFCLCASCSSLPITTSMSKQISVLTHEFDQIAFGREFAAPVEKLVRWDGNLAVSLNGDSAQHWTPEIANQLGVLSNLTELGISLNGMQIRQGPANSKPGGQIHVLMDHLTRLNRKLIRNFPGFRVPASFINESCKSMAITASGGTIRSAFIFVSIDQPESEIHACIIEELAQSMGLFNDITGDHETIFNDDNRINELTSHDRIMMATLYDARLRPGMARREALPIAAEIIGDLLANAGNHQL